MYAERYFRYNIWKRYAFPFVLLLHWNCCSALYVIQPTLRKAKPADTWPDRYVVQSMRGFGVVLLQDDTVLSIRDHKNRTHKNLTPLRRLDIMSGEGDVLFFLYQRRNNAAFFSHDGWNVSHDVATTKQIRFPAHLKWYVERSGVRESYIKAIFIENDDIFFCNKLCLTYTRVGSQIHKMY